MESSLCKIALNFFGSHNFDIQDKNAFEFKHFLMKALGALKNLLKSDNIDSNIFRGFRFNIQIAHRNEITILTFR